jgi:hypothetical protein
MNMTDCQCCHKEINNDDDFVLVGKYPSTMEKWRNVSPSNIASGPYAPENLGTIYHKSCFLGMANKS